MGNCKSCGKETKGDFKYCFQCNQKRKEAKEQQPEEEFKPATAIPQNNDYLRNRLMILSYGKDMVIAGKIDLHNLGDFLHAEEAYIHTGEWKYEEAVK